MDQNQRGINQNESDLKESQQINMNQNINIQKDDEQVLKNYQKKLFIIVTGIFVICIVIIIERIFNEIFQEWESDIIEDVQKSMGLIKDQNGYNVFKSNFFLQMIGYTSIFQVNMLLLTHIFVTIYVAFDAILATKIVYVNLLTYFLSSCIDLIYTGPRPYWISNKIAAPVCSTTFALPSKDVIQAFLLIFYTNFCVNKRKISHGDQINNKKQLIVVGVLTTLAAVNLFLNWINGSLYFMAMIIGFLYFILIYYSLVLLDNYIDDYIKKSSVQSYEAKKYVFYWFFWIILFVIFDCMLYSGSEEYLNIDWVQNYIVCESTFGKIPVGIPNNELIGPWYTFLVSTCLFGLTAAIFGIAHTFRHIGDLDWFKGSTGQRLTRAGIANACMIPSWILVVFQNQIIQTDWIRLSGLNEFFFNGIHFFLLYFWLFGLMPLIVFKKFKMIPQQNNTAKQSTLQPDFRMTEFQDTQTDRSTVNNKEPFIQNQSSGNSGQNIDEEEEEEEERKTQQ